MVEENYIKSFIGFLFPSRRNLNIAGKNKQLKTFKQWYSGKTSWHKRDAIVFGEKKKVPILQSGFTKLIGEEWASAFMNEDTTVTIPKEEENNLLQKIIQKNGVISALNGFTEKYFILGIGATVVMPARIFYNPSNHEILQSNQNEVKISFLDADRFIPITISDGEVTECAILKYSTNKCIIQVHLLDEDETYLIAECEGTYINQNYNFTFSDESIKKWKTGYNQPLFQVWYPNIVDNIDLENPLGTSIIANCIDWLKSFDLTFDRFHTEYKNGGKKRFISSDLLYTNADGEIEKVPLGDEDVYIPKYDSAPNNISEFSSELRAESFIRGLSFFANMIGKSVGLGDNAFEIDSQTGRPLQTATAEILKRNSLYRNIRKNENLATDRLKSMMLAIKFVYNTFIAKKFSFERDDIQVMFDDNVIEDTTSKKQQELAEVQAGVMSIAEFRSHWYDEDLEGAIKFVQENAMLLNQYLPALQSGALPPEQFVDLVFGSKIANRDKIIKYITSQMQSSSFDFEEKETEEVEEDVN